MIAVCPNHHSASRKRQRSETPRPTDAAESASKRQRRGPSAPQPPAAFWDNLSKIWLTKRALRELDRRNASAAPQPPRSPCRRARRPITRKFLAESARDRQAAPYAVDYPRCFGLSTSAIKRFARHGGPDLSDLRHFPEHIHPLNHTMSPSRSSQGRKRGSATTSNAKPTTNTTRTKSTGVYDRDFQQHLIDYDIYPDEYGYLDGSVPAEPTNLADVNRILAQPRPSLSPARFSEEDFRRFKRADAHASKEKQVSELVVPIIEGTIADAKCRSGGLPFTNLDPLTDGTLKPGNPDVYYGARPKKLNRNVREDLRGQIAPSTQHDLPIAPSFTLAAKGPDGSIAVAERQACYDGALGARGMHSLQSYKRGQPIYDSKAYTIASTYHRGTLTMYTSHLTQPSRSGDRPGYHMTQINGWKMTGNLETCRDGMRAYRNGRDWTERLRDEAIEQANKRADESQGTDVSVGLDASFASESRADEPYVIEPGSQRSQPRASGELQTPGEFDESETSTEERVSRKEAPGKRPSRHSQPSAHTRRKRRNASEPSTRHGGGSPVATVSEVSSATHAAIAQSGSWSWANQRFRCHVGPDLVKEQHDTPADVWIHCDQGWPGQGGKTWRLWISATREILYC